MQIKFRFMAEEMENVAKSFVLSFIPAVVIFLVAYVGTIQISITPLAIFVAWALPVISYAAYAAKAKKLTIGKLLWSVVLSGTTALIIYLESTDSWCQWGDVCAVLYSLTTLFAPTLINAFKEWIKIDTGYAG